VAGDPRRGVLWPDRPISPPRTGEISLCGPGGIAGDALLPAGWLVIWATPVSLDGGDPGRVDRWPGHPNPVQPVEHRGKDVGRITELRALWRRQGDIRPVGIGIPRALLRRLKRTENFNCGVGSSSTTARVAVDSALPESLCGVSAALLRPLRSTLGAVPATGRAKYRCCSVDLVSNPG
jgi:hypothetical protein